MTTAKQLMDKVSSIKGDNPNDPDYMRRNSIVGGSFVGLAFGAYYGYSRKVDRARKTLTYGLLGAVIGGVATALFVPK